MRLIDAEELMKTVDKEREYLIARGQTGAEHILVHNFRDLIDNAPTVCGNNPKWCESCVSNGKCASTRQTGECENCDYRKFTEKFIDGIVEVMNKNDISSVEQLSKILKGAEE